MRIAEMRKTTAAAALLAGLALAASRADDPPKPAAAPALTVLDAAGKEQKLKTWTFTAGTRRLGWLAPAAKAPKGKAEGPEALVVRAELKPLYVQGVVTLVPLDRVRSVEYDGEEKAVTVKVATGPKADESLTGTTRFADRGINRFELEADIDKGEAGIASKKFSVGDKGARGLRFAGAKAPAAAPAGRPAVVKTNDKVAHKVADLQPLYQLPGGQEKLLPTLMFKKTLKVDVGKVKKIVATDAEGDGIAWRVVQKDDDDTLTLLTTIPYEGKTARLLGFVGRVPAGYKLIPVLTVKEIEFDAAEEAKEKDPKEKKKEDDD